MKIISIYTIFILILNISNSISKWVSPIYSPKNPEDYQIYPMKSPEILLDSYPDETEGEGEGMSSFGMNLDWQNGINFYIEPAFNIYERRLIHRALFELKLHTCIPVRVWDGNSRPNVNAYVYIQKGRDFICQSHIGRTFHQPQVLYLGPDCLNFQIIMHEILHAYGISHEHQRPDRNNYVSIHWNNIPEKRFSDFEISSLGNNLGYSYDFQSIMHYDRFAFSSNHQPTITAKSFKNNGLKIGPIGKLTNLDIQKIKSLYNCNQNYSSK